MGLSYATCSHFIRLMGLSAFGFGNFFTVFICISLVILIVLVFSSSGNASLEATINWIVEHENDCDIDQMPLV